MIAKLNQHSKLIRYIFVGILAILLLPCIGQSVDPLTGRAVVSIPLGRISAYDLSAGVSLSHHGGALRVNEGPGHAGMGWNVSMGGSISREVRGLPDDLNANGQYGWLYNNSAQTIQNFNPGTESASWNFMNATIGAAIDSEPDIFFFQAPGISGKFIFGPDGLPKTIPYQDIQITFSGGIFFIKTNLGITYTFSVLDVVTRQSFQFKPTVPVGFFLRDYNNYQSPINFVSTWNIASITSAASGVTAYYTYQIGELQYGARYATVVRPNYTNKADTLYYIRDAVSPSLLNQIALKNYSISIAWANSLIDKISIGESESGETKEYDFVYKSINSSGDLLFSHTPKPFLIQVKQQNSCIAYPAYAFGYDGVDTLNHVINVPWRTGWGQDFFGYYNGNDPDKNIPTAYFYQNESGARRFRVTPIPGITPTETRYGAPNPGQNMTVSYPFSGFGALSVIAYPTGGVTNFLYESNKYVDPTTNEELPGPGIRVYMMITSGGEMAFGKPTTSGGAAAHSLTKSYTYLNDAGNLSSGKIVYPPSLVFTRGDSLYRSQTDLGPGSQVLYSIVKEVMPGMGYRVYRYDIPNTYGDPGATTSTVARAPGVNFAIGALQNVPYTFPFAPLKDLDFTRGYLTKLSEFSSAGVLTQEKRMSYIPPQGGTIINGLRFDAILDAQANKNFYYSVYQIPVNQSRMLLKEDVTQVGDASASDSTKVSTSYFYNARNMVVRHRPTPIIRF